LIRVIGTLTALSIGASPLAGEPFGVATVPAAPNSAISAMWRDLQSAMRADEQTVVACRANPTCGSPAALQFIAIVDEARQYQGRALLGHINRAVNLAIPPTRDGVLWRSPLKALASSGDCKSYAVTKYAALGAAGIAPEDRRLVMVWENAHPLETHLIVVVRVALRWLILDNRTLTLVDSTDRSAYQPLHVFDDSGVRERAAKAEPPSGIGRVIYGLYFPHIGGPSK
jgi:predicted transglutaminase-like cysteine proteinase